MARGRPLQLASELVEAFEQSGLVTAYLVRALPSRIWRAKPPAGRGRTIAAIAAHIQSVRRTFARMGRVHPLPPRLDRLSSTPAAAARAIRQGNEALVRLFRASLDRHEARVPGMPRRTVNMLVYLAQHDAHHRGQICWLARDLGHAFTEDEVMRVWRWKKL